MDELTRFARALAERLEARPEGLQRPVSVAAVRTELMPYRRERRALGFSSVEDYETALLRLVAEERGLVRTSPPAAAERCREVLSQPNPDLGVLEEISDSLILLTPLAATGPPSNAPSRPTAESSGRSPADPSSHPAAERSSRPAVQPSSASCRYCQGTLPNARTATFCPWCGKRLVPLVCSHCGTEFESGWRHCIACGVPVSDPYPPTARPTP